MRNIDDRMTWERWWYWVGVYLIAGTLGGFAALWIFAVLTNTVLRTSFQSPSFTGTNRRILEFVILLWAGGGAGAVIALSTASALRRTLNRHNVVWWFLISIGGLALLFPAIAAILNGIVFAWEPPAYFDYLLFALSASITGSSLGLLQWLVLRQQIQLTWWWIPAVGVSWLLLITIFYVLTSMLNL